jgi:O-antigen ligase
VALVGAIPIFAVLKLREWLASSGPKPTFRPAFAWIVILSLPLLLISLIPLGSSIALQAEDVAKEMSKGNGKISQQEAELRIQNWKEGISRGVESGMLGLGPGPHLQIPVSLVAARKREILPSFINTPPANGTPDFEAHNTLVDLFTQGGLIAVLSFVWILATAFFNSYKARQAGLTTLLCGVSLFALGNLIVRQPLFWFTIALCLVSETPIRTALSRNSS